MTGPTAPVRRWPYAVLGLASAGVSLVVLLWYGGGAALEALPGLPHPGLVTTWALPGSRLGAQVFAVATIGLLLAAAVLSPRDGGGLSAIGYRRLRSASWTALAWCVSALAALVFTLSDFLGSPVTQSVSLTALVNFAINVKLGQALALSAGLAAAVFVTCRISIRPIGATVALMLALLATVPPIFTGHTTSAGDHQLAVSSMLLHVIPMTLWAGGLLALALAGRSRTTDLAVAVGRFSRLAAACLAAVAVSGVLSAYVRLSTPADLLASRYGQLVLVKTALVAAIGIAGWWQRRAALPALRDGDRRRFAAVTAVEIALFGLTIGAAVALSRTPPPVPREVIDEDLATTMLGFPMPPPLTAGRLVGYWLPDPLFISAAAAAAGCYLVGVWRLRRRGDAWPAARTVAFLTACALVVIATSSGLARYGPVLFSVHMVQHLLLAMIAPILVALAAPVTLALRALPRAANPAWPGPREWLQRALHLPISRLLTHPVFALAHYVITMYVMYLTGLYELALRSHAAHLLMIGHFLLAGYLFFWVVIGIDPSSRSRPAPPLRMLLLLVSVVLHAFLGIVIMQTSTLLASDWFTTLPRTWGPDPLDDQHTAGGIAWSFGELPAMLVMIALFVQWIRADEREQRRADRAADRAAAEGREDEALAAYNAMLAELARRDQERAGRG